MHVDGSKARKLNDMSAMNRRRKSVNNAHMCVDTAQTHNVLGRIFNVTQENRSIRFRLVECRRDTCVVGV